MDKDSISAMSPQELATFPLDDFFDHYEKGLRKVGFIYFFRVHVIQTCYVQGCCIGEVKFRDVWFCLEFIGNGYTVKENKSDIKICVFTSSLMKATLGANSFL